jgi:hypothetical protein
MEMRSIPQCANRFPQSIHAPGHVGNFATEGMVLMLELISQSQSIICSSDELKKICNILKEKVDTVQFFVRTSLLGKNSYFFFKQKLQKTRSDSAMKVSNKGLIHNTVE